MVLHPRNGISLCAGGGGLDMGLGLAEPGFATAVYVEWEEYPRSALIAGQRAGYLHPAPIWDNVKTFDGRPWRGIIDTVLAGYPCQPFSQAGQRKGADDPRHLWPDVARIIREVEPEWVFLENVAGHLTLGLETVLRELCGMGWTPAVGAFSAAETGAPHERLRVFIVAHRNCHVGRANDRHGHTGTDGRHDAGRGCGNDVAHAHGRNASAKRQQRGGEQRFLAAGGGIGAGDVDHPTSPRCDGARVWAEAHGQGGECLSGDGCDAMGNAAGIGCGEGRAEHGVRIGRLAATGTGSAMADACQPGPQGREQPGSPDQWHRAPAHGSVAERGCARLFPPGPVDADAWADTLATAPDLAPTTGLADCIAWAGRMAQALGGAEQAAAQSALCRMADGLATRSRALRLLGNGVHPLAAAHAWRTLAHAHGLRPVDLGAADRAANGAGKAV